MQESENSAVFLATGIFQAFKFQQHVCKRCHYLPVPSMNLIDIAILNIKSANYCCIIIRISRIEDMNL